MTEEERHEKRMWLIEVIKKADFYWLSLEDRKSVEGRLLVAAEDLLYSDLKEA
jgi:hypothetical protein